MWKRDQRHKRKFSSVGHSKIQSYGGILYRAAGEIFPSIKKGPPTRRLADRHLFCRRQTKYFRSRQSNSGSFIFGGKKRPGTHTKPCLLTSWRTLIFYKLL